MAITLAAKKAVVEEVTQIASKAISAVVADYSGIAADKMTKLREDARKRGVYLRVVRNTLAKLAFQNTELSCLEAKLTGPLFIAISLNAPSDAARLLKDNIKSIENLEVKALCVGSNLYGPEHLETIASLPTRDEAIAKLMYAMKAPVEKLVRTLAAPQTKLVRTLVAYKEQKAN